MRYYSTQRPIFPGSFPRKAEVQRIENFDRKKFCEEIGREAWGMIEYKRELQRAEADAYELVPAGMKLYYCVTSSVNNRGRVVAAITDVIEAVCKPENRSVSTSRKDIYIDWFSDPEEAKKFVEDAKRA